MTKYCFLYFLIVSLLNIGCQKQAQKPAHFSFNLLNEPSSLDPKLITGASGNYLLNNIFRGLTFTGSDGLKNENAKSCKWLTTTHLKCTLKKLKYSNGAPVTGHHYKTTFQELLKGKSIEKAELMNIKGVKEYLRDESLIKNIGIHSTDSTVEFNLLQPDKDFLQKLASPAYSPTIVPQNYHSPKDASKIITNGPYKVKEWIQGKHILLSPNSFYDQHSSTRPLVKIYFLENDETAVNLYQTGQLSFLRRLPTSYFKTNVDNPQFFFTPILRFDYIGLTGELNKYPSLKKALALSLNYKELKEIYKAKGLPGCPGLPRSFFKDYPCHQANIPLAKQLFSQLPTDVQNMTWTLHFSRLGGKDIRKGMEWAHNQWKKHLGLKIKLQAVEQGMYLNQLRNKNINLFRKGVGVDLHSCLSALKTFSNSSYENYISYNNDNFEHILLKMALPTNQNKKELCSQGTKELIKSYSWIPLGEIHFAMMSDGNFSGWSVNKLNQLDLTGLHQK